MGRQARFPEIGKVTDQAHEPGGAEGALPPAQLDQPFDLRLLAGPAGGPGFPALADAAEAVGRLVRVADTYYQPFLHGYDNAPMWNVEPRNLPYRDALATAHLPGWPAPASRQLAEVVAKYVVIDMFAKACAGASTKDVIKDAGASSRTSIARPEHDDRIRASTRTWRRAARKRASLAVCSTAKACSAG